jgi:hypothetical protein
MSQLRWVAALCCAVAVGGCETAPQTVTLTTTPRGAACTVSRLGAILGRVAYTPGAVALRPSPDPIAVSCAMPEHQTARATRAATAADAGAAALFGPRSYAYPPEIHLDLEPGEPAPAPAPPIPVTAIPLPR